MQHDAHIPDTEGCQEGQGGRGGRAQRQPVTPVGKATQRAQGVARAEPEAIALTTDASPMQPSLAMASSSQQPSTPVPSYSPMQASPMPEAGPRTHRAQGAQRRIQVRPVTERNTGKQRKAVSRMRFSKLCPMEFARVITSPAEKQMWLSMYTDMVDDAGVVDWGKMARQWNLRVAEQMRDPTTNQNIFYKLKSHLRKYQTELVAEHAGRELNITFAAAQAFWHGVEAAVEEPQGVPAPHQEPTRVSAQTVPSSHTTHMWANVVRTPPASPAKLDGGAIRRKQQVQGAGKGGRNVKKTCKRSRHYARKEVAMTRQHQHSSCLYRYPPNVTAKYLWPPKDRCDMVECHFRCRA
eukprot:jgi/Chlat1/1597/Chrsp124S01861